MKNIYCLLIVLLPIQFANAQSNAYDSLEQRLSREKTDTVKLELLSQLVSIAFNSDISKALDYAKKRRAAF